MRGTAGRSRLCHRKKCLCFHGSIRFGEVEGGTEACFDIRNEESWAAVDDMAEVVATDVGFPEEECDGGDDGGEGEGEDFRAEGYKAVEGGRGEGDGGGKEGNGGFDVGNGGGDEGRVGEIGGGGEGFGEIKVVLEEDGRWCLVESPDGRLALPDCVGTAAEVAEEEEQQRIMVMGMYGLEVGGDDEVISKR
ncbi:hypothetical protein E3N88_16241 [Mikania micrantha]|uniref:Uncharacterized protein n=1 Tax=Mikania micrantha TaxID=192012 RepID=A0A5N6NZK8_9ASTR|nr:hypothetical protein E3N88_16241 [Mikania micrantha]